MLENVMHYPTFIVFCSIGVSVLFTLLLMPLWIKFLKFSHIGQQVRADGPETHLIKQGTPTMGGVIMLITMVLTCAFVGYWSPENIGVIIAIIAAGVLGFIDDGAKVIFHRSLGLTAVAKLVCQYSIATAFILYAINYVGVSAVVSIPFIVDIDLGVFTTVIPIGSGIAIPWLYVILVDMLIVGMCNAVNLTDGLDGLAAGTSIIVMIVMAAIAFRTNELGVSVVAASLAGFCIAFLWHNSYPASIFMGDTGSLALGMGLGCIAVITKTEFVSIVVGGLYVIEALSVMIQVAYFKKTHKRIFLMAPLHHHFEKKGWGETKVVIRLWLISAGFATAGFIIYFASTLFG